MLEPSAIIWGSPLHLLHSHTMRAFILTALLLPCVSQAASPQVNLGGTTISGRSNTLPQFPTAGVDFFGGKASCVLPGIVIPSQTDLCLVCRHSLCRTAGEQAALCCTSPEGHARRQFSGCHGVWRSVCAALGESHLTSCERPRPWLAMLSLVNTQMPDGASEDCLTLNVFRPSSTASNAKLPVMVWMFGGGFNQGFSSQFNASAIIAQSVTRVGFIRC